MAVWRDLDELKLWERNYNRGDVQQIKKSILRFGFNNALRVWRDSIIMAGNHSTIALRECLADGWTETADGIKLANGKLLRGGAVVGVGHHRPNSTICCNMAKVPELT